MIHASLTPPLKATVEFRNSLYRAHIGKPFGSRSNASAFSTGHLE